MKLFNRFKKNKDYCTLFFDKIGDYDIGGCCRVHDEDYDNPNILRKDADIWLKNCVNKTTNSNIGNLMYLGVRCFGWIFWYWHKFIYKYKHK